jgi:hypothetical protein
MKAGWFKRLFNKPKGFYPRDNNQYIIDSQVMAFTDQILKDYGNKKPSCEGLVYWAGKVENNKHYITHAVAPKIKASRRDIYTTHESNGVVVEYLCDNDLVYIAQVHSHPGDWVEHSEVDNEETAFRSEGLVSIVVPVFSNRGILPWSQCGFHLFTAYAFKFLSTRYVNKRFNVRKLNKETMNFKDFRNEQGLV